MKNNSLFSLIGLLFFAITANAQVPNPSFEEFIGYGNETRFWGPNPTIIPVTIDPNGTETADTIIYDEGTNNSCFYNNEAHTGDRAMEIRNAFNISRNEPVAGKMILFNEDGGSVNASGWNTGYTVSEGAVLNGLGFYYKFSPLGYDIAQANIEVFGESGLIGTATIEINQAASEYTYVYAPISFTSNETPIFMNITFSMANPTFGSRFVVDDVATDFDLLSLNTLTIDSKIAVFPTLVTNEINIDTKGATQGKVAYKIINTEGKIVKQNTVTESTDYLYTMNVSGLSAGMYFISIESSLGKTTKKFLKK